MLFQKAHSLKGELTIPGDKSISHRAIMLGALSEGTTEISNFLQGADCLSTISCFEKMGISIEKKQSTVLIYGKGLHGLNAPSSLLDVGNSGTTLRLLTGILAGQNFNTTITGDSSIQKRPMERVITPLSQMGADITSNVKNNCAPLSIIGKPLHSIHYHSPIASAQVKSSILLAGLYADGETSVTEPYLSRNHTELMFNYFGIPTYIDNNTITIKPVPKLMAKKISVPGDISSAAYFIAAALLVPNSELLLKNVGINPTRNGLLQICKDMGANIQLKNQSTQNGEATADLLIRTSSLTGVTVEGSIIPTLIDEIPILSILACAAKGTTIIKDAQELKVKESNRINTIVENLTKMGADITATEDGMIINGGKSLYGTTINSYHDHRIAMSFAIAALIAEGKTTISDSECITISYPDFYQQLKKVTQNSSKYS